MKNTSFSSNTQVNIPSELNLVFSLIKNNEAKERAKNCLYEILAYIRLLNKLPRSARNVRNLTDQAVQSSLNKMQEFEGCAGVSSAMIALSAFYSNEIRSC